jgi:hypothetical protein
MLPRLTGSGLQPIIQLRPESGRCEVIDQMKLWAIFAVLGFAMTFCNLGEKLNSSSQSGPANQAPPANAAPLKAPDRESVKNELVRLINKIAQASVDGDIVTLTKVTTDDFEQTDVEGKVQNKNEALAEVKKEKSIRSWSITQTELTTLTDDTAVMKYLLSLTLKNGRSGKARVTETFVKEDGDWLLKSSHQTMVK